MEVYYDLHMHSCLSPCGSDDMTPYNLVNMAALAGLQVIALSDHNTTKNCPAAVRAGEEAGVLVVPAMELTTKEDIHILCLFPDCDAAEQFRQFVYARLPKRKNRPKAFGYQLIMDHLDNILGEEEQLLNFGSEIGVYEVAALAELYGGFAVPAHIDRASFSLLRVMGLVDPAMGFKVYETTPGCDWQKLYADRNIVGGHICSSDAHDLTAIPDASRTLNIASATAASVIRAVRALGREPRRRGQ